MASQWRGEFEWPPESALLKAWYELSVISVASPRPPHFLLQGSFRERGEMRPRAKEGTVNKGQKIGFVQCETMGSTVAAAPTFQKIQSEEGEVQQPELLDNRRHVRPRWHFKPTFTQMLYGTCVLLVTKIFPPSWSVQSLEVVIIIRHPVGTCWSSSGERTGKVFQYSLNQTATLWWAQNIILSSLLVPNFPLWKLVKRSQRGWNIWRTWNRKGNIVRVVRLSWWLGSVCMCKFFLRSQGRLRESLWSVTFQVFLGVFLHELVSLGSVDAVGTPGEPHDDGDDGGLEEEHHPIGGSYGWSR